MSIAQIKNILYDKTAIQFKYIFQSNSFNCLTYHFIDSLITTSKNNFTIINFDLSYYRYCLLKGHTLPFTITQFDITEIASQMNNKSTFIIIGADILDWKNLTEIIYYIDNIDKANVIFFISTDDNVQLIQSGAFMHFIEVMNAKKNNSLYVKVDAVNLYTSVKENIVFEYELIDNRFVKGFKDFVMYKGEMINLFEEIVKMEEHETTFNLKLTKEEIEVKNSIQLPYFKTQEEKRNFIEKEKAEEDDDLYEDDPDDDLDI